MGMDVMGRNPSSHEGECFRANLWSWRPIHALCVELCSDVLNEETLAGMCINDGAGPTDQETCSTMADRFDLWLISHTSGHTLDCDFLRVTKGGRFVDEQEMKDNPDLETESPYVVHDEHLKEWVRFLQHCGGFEVW